MYKLMYVGGLALILILMVISCQNDTPTSPQPQFDVYVQIDTVGAIIALEDEIQAVAIELFISDDSGEPVSGIPFQIWVESGPGATAYRQTESDPEGIVQVLYYLTVPFGDTTAVIKAVAGTDTTETSISVIGLASPASIEISGPAEILPNYNESTEATLSARLLDRRGSPLSGHDVLFALISGQAEVGGLVQTDLSGNATTTVTVDGYWSGDLILVATVVAQDQEQLREQMLSHIKIEADRNLVDRFLHGFAPLIDSEPLMDQITIPVRVQTTNPTSVTIDISGGNPNYWVGLDDSNYMVIAELRDANNDPVAGVDVTLLHSLGDDVAPSTTNRHGIAMFRYTPLMAGVEELTVSVEGSEIAQEGLTFPVFSGSITFTHEVEWDTTNHPTREFVLYGHMSDEIGRGIPNERIGIRSTLGRLFPYYLNTDMGGNYEVEFHSTGEYGVAILTFQWREITAQTAVSLFPPLPAKIEFPELIRYSYPDDSTYNGTIRDRKQRVIRGVPTPVFLELINSGSFSNGSSIDTVMSSNGSFNVRVGGEGRGCINRLSDDSILRLTILPDSAGENGTTAYSHFIVEGDPAHIELRIHAIGSDVGGGTWQVIVEAIVTDRHGNPVRDNIPIEPYIMEESATIQPGFTGNGDDPVPGVAFSQMTYNSNNTFDTIRVSAFVLNMNRDTISTQEDFILPLQEGVLELNIDPQHWMVEEDDDTVTVRVWAILNDGHNILINNAPIEFTANRGHFYYDRGGIGRPHLVPFGDGPVIRFTGPENDGVTNEERIQDDDPRGHAVVWWRGTYDMWDPWPEQTIQFQADIEGYEDVSSDPAFLFITRRP